MTSEEDTGGAASAASAPPASSDTPSVLRNFASQLVTPSLRERHALFDATWTHLDAMKTPLPDPAVKALCRVMPVVLARFREGGSRFRAGQMVELLLRINPGVATAALTQSLWDAFSPAARAVPTAANARTALAALGWAAAVYEKADKPDEKGVRLLAVLAHAVFGVVGGGDAAKRLKASAERTLWAMWRTNGSKKDALEKMLSGGMEVDFVVRSSISFWPISPTLAYLLDVQFS